MKSIKLEVTPSETIGNIKKMISDDIGIKDKDREYTFRVLNSFKESCVILYSEILSKPEESFLVHNKKSVI